MNDNVTQTSMFGTEKIYKILLQLAPPVMFAQVYAAFAGLPQCVKWKSAQNGSICSAIPPS